jgi:hypothetical protein
MRGKASFFGPALVFLMADPTPLPYRLAAELIIAVICLEFF